MATTGQKIGQTVGAVGDLVSFWTSDGKPAARQERLDQTRRAPVVQETLRGLPTFDAIGPGLRQQQAQAQAAGRDPLAGILSSPLGLALVVGGIALAVANASEG